MTKKERKAARKKYFDEHYKDYVYNAPVDPRDVPMYDSFSEVEELFGKRYPNNDTNSYPPIREYENKK